DRLAFEAQMKLQMLFDSLGDDNVGFNMKWSVPDPKIGVSTLVHRIRLFRNHPEIRWRYRVHEQIFPALHALKDTLRFTDIVINHIGYLDPELLKSKRQRNLYLLKLELSEHPDEPFILFNLGSLYYELHRPSEALPFLRRSLELSGPNAYIAPKLQALIVNCH